MHEKFGSFNWKAALPFLKKRERHSFRENKEMEPKKAGQKKAVAEHDKVENTLFKDVTARLHMFLMVYHPNRNLWKDAVIVTALPCQCTDMRLFGNGFLKYKTNRFTSDEKISGF